MPLAATLATDGMRPASFLPTIKCSSCGNEIAISAMGEHICGTAPVAPEPTPAPMGNPFTLRQSNAVSSKPAQPSPLRYDSPPPQTRPRAPTVGSQTSIKPHRAALPQINPDVANRAFLAPLPRSELPISPAASTRSGSSLGEKPPPPLRSQTNPVPRLYDPRPPSPEYSANLDCAFPPFPFSDTNSSRPSSSSGRGTPNGSEVSSRSGSRQDARLPDFSSIETASPISNAGEAVMNRMNTLTNGPFDPARRRPSNDDRSQEQNEPLDRRRPSPLSEEPLQLLSSAKFERAVSRPSPAAKSNGEDISKPSAPNTKTTEKTMPPTRPERPDTLSPSFLNTFSAEPASMVHSLAPGPSYVTENHAFPFAQNEVDTLPKDLSKMLSEPALRSRQRRSTMSTTSSSEPSHVPKLFPPRTQDADESRMDYRLLDAPPVPKPVQLHRSDSFHRPSGSDSSAVSSTPSTGISNSSSGQSPIASTASSVDMYSPVPSEGGGPGDERRVRAADSNTKNLEPGMRAEQRKQKEPPRNFARPSPPRQPQLPPEEPPVSTESNWPLESPLESPMDPAMQNGRLGGEAQKFESSHHPPKSPIPGVGLSPADFLSDDYDPYRPVSPLPASTRPPKEAAHTRARSKTTNELPSIRPFEATNPASLRPQPPQLNKASTFAQDSPRAQAPTQYRPRPPPIPDNAPRPQLSRRPTVSARVSCRGCGLTIEGKSVKAADGRLTGRWHRQCFVCRTCEQPFDTADFYVLNNHPYCEHHYHEKNGSLCAGCRRGIEGQYLETTSPGPNGRVEKKYHPRCFTCSVCRVVLSDDYFEISGRVFCERHALAAMRAQPRQMGPPGVRPGPGALMPPHGGSGLRAERRTTKLMMMQ